MSAAGAGPWSWVEERARRGVLVALTILAVSLTGWLGVLGDPLVTESAPAGIVSFELARSVDGAQAVLASWDAAAREAAMLVQGVDSLYLLVYPAAFSLAALMLGARLGGRWRGAGLALSWIVLAAAPLDAVENLALLRQLHHGPAGPVATLAWACAVPKFALVAASFAFLGAGGVAAALSRRRR